MTSEELLRQTQAKIRQINKLNKTGYRLPLPGSVKDAIRSLLESMPASDIANALGVSKTFVYNSKRSKKKNSHSAKAKSVATAKKITTDSNISSCGKDLIEINKGISDQNIPDLRFMEITTGQLKSFVKEENSGPEKIIIHPPSPAMRLTTKSGTILEIF